MADNEPKQLSAFLKSHSADQNNPNIERCLSCSSTLQYYQHSGISFRTFHSFIPVHSRSGKHKHLLFKNRAGAAHKQMENSYNYWLQVLQKLNPFAVLPFKMHGNKATEISIQWSLKSSLPAQNVKINHHTLYHQQSYFFSSVMTTRIMTVTKANYYCLHYYS